MDPGECPPAERAVNMDVAGGKHLGPRANGRHDNEIALRGIDLLAGTYRLCDQPPGTRHGSGFRGGVRGIRAIVVTAGFFRLGRRFRGGGTAARQPGQGGVAGQAADVLVAAAYAQNLDRVRSADADELEKVQIGGMPFVMIEADHQRQVAKEIRSLSDLVAQVPLEGVRVKMVQFHYGQRLGRAAQFEAGAVVGCRGGGFAHRAILCWSNRCPDTGSMAP